MRYPILAGLLIACSVLVLGGLALEDKKTSLMRSSTDDATALKSTKREAESIVPDSIVGVSVISAQDVVSLQKQGAWVIDTRSVSDYFGAHIPGSLHAAYHEHSAQRADFDAHDDDVGAFLARLHRLVPQTDHPVIFYCNGVQCWKSYKAIIAAQQAGYGTVFWFRGGMAEWKNSSRPIESDLR